MSRLFPEVLAYLSKGHPELAAAFGHVADTMPSDPMAGAASSAAQYAEPAPKPGEAQDMGEALLTNLPVSGLSRNAVRYAPQALGAVAGNIGGAAGGPMGIAAGGVLGAAAGEAARQGLANMTAGYFNDQGLPINSPSQVMGEVGSAAENAAYGEALGLGMMGAAKAYQLGPEGTMNAIRAANADIGEAGMVTFHGTPHTFAPEPDAPLGKFRLDKMGTGEGAQAYGWGHYVAENPATGKEYRATLSKRSPLIDGKPFEEGLSSLGISDEAKKILRYNLSANDEARIERFARQGEPAYQEAWKVIQKKQENPGHLYSVDLPDEHIAKMLDWDAPLSGQHESVRKTLSDGFRVVKEADSDGPFVAYFHDMPLDAAKTKKALLAKFEENPGAMLVNGVEPRGSPMRMKLSKTLDSLGIPGIKFYDQGSRGAMGSMKFLVENTGSDGRVINSFRFNTKAEAEAYVAGKTRAKQAKQFGYSGHKLTEAEKGTRNFVVFNDNTLKIVGKE